MQIEFDPNKDRINLDKHGVSLALAAELHWDAALVWIDNRHDYGEDRILALVPRGATLYYAAVVDRAGVRRVISLRRANRREAKKYVEIVEQAFDPDSQRE
ncbi:MAG: BrnT family toxin [Burkholderiales bacterium]